MFEFKIFGFDFLYLFYCFIIYAFIGWVMESVYATTLRGRFVNRGFLNGPFCPIYGFGVLTLIVVLTPVINNIPLLFIGGMILTSALEYLTGFILEKAFHSTWWDYSKRPLNIKGRVCMEFSIIWGVLSIIVMRILKPLVDRIVVLIPESYKELFLYVLMVYFVVDLAITIRSVVELNLLLQQLHKVSVEMRYRMEILKETAVERLDEAEQRIQVLRDRYEEVLEKRAFLYRRLTDAFPNLKNREFDNVLMDVREKINAIRKLRMSVKNKYINR